MTVNPAAGKPATQAALSDVPRVVAAYFTERPDPAVAAQRVSFGTSGHRGASLAQSFNEWHILAISQAICSERKRQGVTGPLFLGIDTHALSVPAAISAVEVFAANGIEVMLAEGDEFTPTPVISHAIIAYNRGRTSGLADGVVVTPSHNPPGDGGFKYNPPHGGPADSGITDRIGAAANAFLECGLQGVGRVTYAAALRAPTTHRHDYRSAYIDDLANVIDMEAIRAAKVRFAVDPLGGAGVHYWGRIAERHGLDLTVLNETVDPTFRFMCVDHDGKIRMDPSSPYAMRGLIAQRERFDLCVACDTDHDRHGIVTRSAGLMPPNHYLATAISHLFQHRPAWGAGMSVGKTMVSSQLIDRAVAGLGRRLHEVPVGFKWFVDGLHDGSLGFGGEESAGASFARRDGGLWTTDKDGITLALLAAEILGRTGRDPGDLYTDLTRVHGVSTYDRIDAPATPAEKRLLAGLSPQQLTRTTLAGDPIRAVLTRAPSNDAPLGGLKVVSDHGWFAARPSGTEDIYKIYAESFNGPEHLTLIQQEAQAMVGETLAPARAKK